MRFLKANNYNFKSLKKNKIKNLLWFSIIFICIIFFVPNIMFAQDDDKNYYDELYNATFEELNNYDFDLLDNILNKIEIDDKSSSSISFIDIVKNILNGNLNIEETNIIKFVFKLFLSNIREVFPVCLIVVFVAIFVRCLKSFSPNVFKNGISDIINFVSIAVVVVLISKFIVQVNNVVISTSNTMQNVINYLFPILLTTMGIVGASSSVSIFTPITTILNTGISNIITNLLFPVYVLSFVLIVVSSLTQRVKLNKFIDFIGSLFKTIISVLFGIMSTIFVIKGVSAGRFDNVGIFSTKFAIKNYIPIIGTYISEGFNYLMLSSVLIKNSVGLAGIVLMLLIILMPVIYILVLRLLFHFISSLIEVVGDTSISVFLEKVSKIMAFPLTVILGVAFMFIMTLSLVISTANLL